MDQRTQTAIRRLASARPAVEPLAAPGEMATIPASIGFARDTRGGAGGGIASPLTEISRTLHATQAVSSDGLFVWSVPETIEMEDGAGQTVTLIFASPT